MGANQSCCPFATWNTDNCKPSNNYLFHFLSPLPIVTDAQAGFQFADDFSKIPQYSRECTPSFVMTCSATLQTQHDEILKKEHKMAKNYRMYFLHHYMTSYVCFFSQTYRLKGDENTKQWSLLKPAYNQHQWGPLHDTQLALCLIRIYTDPVEWVEWRPLRQGAAGAQHVWWDMERHAFDQLGDEEARGSSFGCLQLPWGRGLWWRSQTRLWGAQG